MLGSTKHCEGVHARMRTVGDPEGNLWTIGSYRGAP